MSKVVAKFPPRPQVAPEVEFRPQIDQTCLVLAQIWNNSANLANTCPILIELGHFGQSLDANWSIRAKLRPTWTNIGRSLAKLGQFGPKLAIPAKVGRDSASGATSDNCWASLRQFLDNFGAGRARQGGNYPGCAASNSSEVFGKAASNVPQLLGSLILSLPSPASRGPPTSQPKATLEKMQKCESELSALV